MLWPDLISHLQGDFYNVCSVCFNLTTKSGRNVSHKKSLQEVGMILCKCDIVVRKMYNVKFSYPCPLDLRSMQDLGLIQYQFPGKSVTIFLQRVNPILFR